MRVMEKVKVVEERFEFSDIPPGAVFRWAALKHYPLRPSVYMKCGPESWVSLSDGTITRGDVTIMVDEVVFYPDATIELMRPDY
tara:strand:- start:1689 stop:1940 length:252 start_codon:yes stop_codon:yes gene_type:complete